jgi:hypothetical protein
MADSFLTLPAQVLRRPDSRVEVLHPLNRTALVTHGPMSDDGSEESNRRRPAMISSRRWRVDISIDEHDDERTTRAEARLQTNDRTDLVGRGTAHRNPADSDVPEIGDELAVARALSELAHELLHSAASDIEQITHERVHLHS